MTRGREMLVGFVIIIAVATAVAGTLWLQGTNFGRPMIAVEVLLETVGQLAEGNRVTYRGVGIGQVSEIAVEPGGRIVRATFLIDEDVALPDDAAVLLGPESLFGDWQAEIVVRSSYPRFPFYEPSAEERSRPVPVLGGYALPELSQLTASAEQISANLADLTDRLELAFNEETAQNLSRAIDNIGAVSEEVRTLVAQQAEVARSVTANADSALAEIEAASRVARRLFDRVDGAVGEAQLDSILTNMAIAAAGMRRVTGELADSTGGLVVTLERMDSVFARMDRMSAQIEAGEGSIGRLFADSTFALRAEEVLGQLDLLLQDLRENPRRYVRLSIF